MTWRLLLAAFLAISYATTAEPVEAKGGPSPIDYAVISGGQLSASRQIPVKLPENYDYMSERFDIQEDAVTLGRAQFGILIHMTWPEEKDESGKVVQRAQVWEIQGRYDGDSLIYLPDSQHGNRAGWFAAHPLFAEQLRAGLAAPTAPSAGNSLLSGENDESLDRARAAGLAMVFAAAALGCLCRLSRRWPQPGGPS